MYFNLLAAALAAIVCFTYYHLALPSNQAVSYSMLQSRTTWLTLLSVYFKLELSIVLVWDFCTFVVLILRFTLCETLYMLYALR